MANTAVMDKGAQNWMRIFIDLLLQLPLKIKLYIYMDATECIVCVPGHDPLMFFFLSSCLFLIGWELYGRNYLKC